MLLKAAHTEAVSLWTNFTRLQVVNVEVSAVVNLDIDGLLAVIKNARHTRWSGHRVSGGRERTSSRGKNQSITFLLVKLTTLTMII